MADIINYLEKIKNAVFGRDVRDSIHDGIKAINDEVEDTTQKQNTLNVEIVQARGRHSLLNTRVEQIESQSRSVGDYAIGNFIELTGGINELQVELGQAGSSGVDYTTKKRCTTISFIYLRKGAIVTLKDLGNYSFALCCYDLTGAYISGTSWNASQIAVNTDAFYKIIIKKNTEELITNEDLQVIAKLITITQPSTLTREITEKLDRTRQTLDIVKCNTETLSPVFNIPLGNTRTIAGGDYWLHYFTDNTKDGKYRLVLQTDDLEGKFGSCICIRQRGVAGQNANRTNATYLGDGIYYLDHQNINTEDYYSEIHLFIDLREFPNDNINITQLKLSEINNEFPVDVNNEFDLNITLAKLSSGLEHLTTLHTATNIQIEARNFLQLYIKDYDLSIAQTYRAIVQTDDLSGNFSNYICLRQGSNSSKNANRVNSTYLGNGYYYIELNTVVDVTYSNMEFFIDLRDSEAGINILAYQVSKVEVGTIKANSEITEEKVLYVSPNGSDENTGLSSKEALASLNKAYMLGATTILCERGDYYNQPSMQYTAQFGKSLKILPYSNNTSFSSDVPVRPLINIINGKEIIDLIETDGLLTKSLEPDDRITKVFIDKTLAPVVESRSVGYNATIWQLHEDDTLDTKLKPVLTIEECKAEKGTFHHDGTNVYINPFEGKYTKFILPNCLDNLIQLTGFSELVIEDLAVSFAYNNNFTLTNNMNMTPKNCQAKYACLGQGFALDNSNANLYNCYAFKNRNDGFNIHGYGVTNFYNCSGKYNYDDGISHHDGCEGIIDGGEWSYNGKGGISSPTHGAYNDIYNVECHNNAYGIYAVSSSDRRKCKGRIFNSVMHNNTSADIAVTLADIKVYNTKYSTKNVSSDASLIEL